MLAFLKSQLKILHNELYAEPSKRGIDGVASLDGLRGLAVLFVFLHHSYVADLWLIKGFSYLSDGKRGVWLFFGLSAYLLTYSFFRKGEKSLSGPSLVTYGKRRFLRIYPLYTAVLVTSLLTTLALHDRTGLGFPFIIFDFKMLVNHLLLMEGRNVMWSIGVEFKYYLVIPFFAYVFIKAHKVGVSFSLLLFAVLMIGTAYVWPTREMAVNDRNLGPYLPVFFAGSFFAYLSAAYDKAGIAKLHPGWNKVVHWVGCALAISALVATQPLHGILPGARTWDRLLASEMVYSGLFWGMVIFAFTKGKSWVTWIFTTGFMRSLGIICFGFYLMHPMMITVVSVAKRFVAIPHTLDILLAFGLTYVAAGLSYVYIEKPFFKYR